MKRWQVSASRGAVLLAALGALGVTPLAATADTEMKAWVVSGKLLGKPKDNGEPDNKGAADVSGLACEPGLAARRLCILADDESQGAQLIILEAGRITAGAFIRLITDSYNGKALELDAEAVAFYNGAFYVIGSHGRPRHEADSDGEAKNLARARASQRVFRIRFAADVVDMATGKIRAGRSPEVTEAATWSGAIANEPQLANVGHTALADNGLTIEGLAISGDRMLVGFRGPVLASGEALIQSVPLDEIFAVKPPKAQLEPVVLGRDSRGLARGVRDLAPAGADLLVLAGPVSDPPDNHIAAGDYAIFVRRGDETRKILDLPAYSDAVKPEALGVIGLEGGTVRLLMLFDGPTNGAPSELSIDLPAVQQTRPGLKETAQ